MSKQELFKKKFKMFWQRHLWRNYHYPNLKTLFVKKHDAERDHHNFVLSHTSNTGSVVNCTGRITWQIASFLFQLPSFFLPSVHLSIPKTRLPTPFRSRLNNLQCVTTEKKRESHSILYGPVRAEKRERNPGYSWNCLTTRRMLCVKKRVRTAVWGRGNRTLVVRTFYSGTDNPIKM